MSSPGGPCACGCGAITSMRQAEYVRGHRPPSDPVERFWNHVDRSGGPSACWPWTLSLFPPGYGRFVVRPFVSVTAHRFAYETTVGAIPEGMEIDHKCHTDDASCAGGNSCPHRRCANPAHLEPVTR